jgi:hypothetical protein
MIPMNQLSSNMNRIIVGKQFQVFRLICLVLKGIHALNANFYLGQMYFADGQKTRLSNYQYVT